MDWKLLLVKDKYRPGDTFLGQHANIDKCRVSASAERRFTQAARFGFAVAHGDVCGHHCKNEEMVQCKMARENKPELGDSCLRQD